jgi:ribosome biogenesis GTPase A
MLANQHLVCRNQKYFHSSFCLFLVNKLRNLFNNKASCEQVGASPGVTRTMSERVKISTRPKVYIRDSPGILEPRLKSPDESFRLLLTNCIPIQQRELSDIIADYGVFLFNKYGKHREYVKYCELDRPTDDILTVLLSLAKIKNCTQMYGDKRGYDLTGAALHLISEINKGRLGR